MPARSCAACGERHPALVATVGPKPQPLVPRFVLDCNLCGEPLSSHGLNDHQAEVGQLIGKRLSRALFEGAEVSWPWEWSGG